MEVVTALGGLPQSARLAGFGARRRRIRAAGRSGAAGGHSNSSSSGSATGNLPAEIGYQDGGRSWEVRAYPT